MPRKNPLAPMFNCIIEATGKDLFAHFISFLQEYMAVTFQLVCLSRLGATPLLSTLVLFLTLVVFTGPLLNAWLMIVNHICVLKSPPQMILLVIFIMGAHAAGAVSAWGIVAAFATDEEKSAKTMLFWKNPEKVLTLTALNLENWKLLDHFFDELFGATSLLIGCVYLLWLAEYRKEKDDQSTSALDHPRIHIRFYLQLTLLVAAVSQAFPSAHLSPHISAYLLFTQQIPAEVFGVRFGAGFVACFFTWVWALFRTSYRNEIQKQVHPKHEHHVKTQPDITVSKAAYTSQYALLPPVRLSMQGGSYF